MLLMKPTKQFGKGGKGSGWEKKKKNGGRGRLGMGI
jgi:hypothetical protein